jgi:hypothetical protein
MSEKVSPRGGNRRHRTVIPSVKQENTKGQFCGTLKFQTHANGSWDDVFFVVSDPFLLFYQDEETKKPFNKIDLSDTYCSSITSKKNENNMAIQTSSQIYTLKASHWKEVEIWLQHLNTCSKIYEENEWIRKAETLIENREIKVNVDEVNDHKEYEFL